MPLSRSRAVLTGFSGFVERLDPQDATVSPAERAAHIARYAFAARLPLGPRALDCACGTGYGALLLAGDHTRQVVGMDIDPAALALALKRGQPPNLLWLCGDALRPATLPGSFSSVVSFETIEHVAEPDDLLVRFREALRPRGLLVISTPNGDITSPIRGWPPANPFHAWEEGPVAFERRLRRAGFSPLGRYGQLPLSDTVRAAVRLARARGQLLRCARLYALERFNLTLERKLAPLLGFEPAISDSDVRPAEEQELAHYVYQVYVCERI